VTPSRLREDTEAANFRGLPKPQRCENRWELTRDENPPYDESSRRTNLRSNSVGIATLLAAQVLRALPRVQISRAVGRLCDQPLPPLVSRAVTGAYCRTYRVDMEDAELPNGAFASFDAFFTRPLKTGARAVSSDSLVSPSDGELSSQGVIDPGARIFVKGQPYDVGELVGDPRDAARYAGGEFAVVYLAPRDYHRVHSPVDGAITLIRGLPGDLYPVNSIGEKHIPQLFVKNQRAAIVIDTPGFGRVTVVMVGATIVGRISVSVLDAPQVPVGTHAVEPVRNVRRGDEIGIFHLGSTVVLLLEPGLAVARPTGTIRYGESLLRPA
jgi:phosphatidylserine decarboxylase